MSSKNITFTDEQIVAYLNQDIDEKTRSQIDNQLIDNEQVIKQVSFWQEVLFTLYQDIDEVSPPKNSWKKIENKLFTPSKKTKLITHLIPAFLTLMLVFSIGIYLSLRPNYQATIQEKQTILWKISGNNKSIQFTSLTDISIAQKNCIAFLKKAGNTKMIALGSIPDTGNHQKWRINLVEQLNVQAGDSIIIVQTDQTDLSKIKPKTNDHTVALQPI